MTVSNNYVIDSLQYLDLPNVGDDSSDEGPIETATASATTSATTTRTATAGAAISSQVPTSAEPRSKKSIKSKIDDTILTLAGCISQLESEHSHVQQMLRESSNNCRRWALWMAGEVEEFNPEEWLGFHQEVSGLLYKYKRQVLQHKRGLPSGDAPHPRKPPIPGKFTAAT